MKHIILSLLAFTFVSFAQTQVQAGILIEPYIGYEMGKITAEATVGGTPVPVGDADYDGYNLGARLGFSTLGFSFGADYMLSTGEDEDKDESSMNHLGAFVGFDFPVLFRVYAVYMFSVKNTQKDTANNTETDLEGSGYKLGVGFTGLPFVSINLEAIVREFDEESGTVLGQPYTLSLKTASTMLSVSIPLP